jgi:hypothetical protein
MQDPSQPFVHPFVRRILSRLLTAETEEPDPWLRDDLQIARLTVTYAARGAAVECSPQVLASYAVLGLHPEKVWPAIEARRLALGPLHEVVSDAPPKKPAQSAKLWAENTKGARAVNSRASEAILHESREPMSAIAALYPNPDAPSSAKKRGFTYDEMLSIVEFSGAPHSVRQGTLAALKARGRWPQNDGPVTGVVCVSLIGMMFQGVCCRSTARWRARRAVRLGYWRQLRAANSWSNCPRCGAQRETGACGSCPYVGRAKTPEGKPNFDEFCRPYMYEINVEAFRTAPRCRELRHFKARTYSEYKDGAQREERAQVTEMPRKSPQPSEPPDPAPAAHPATPMRPTAEHRPMDAPHRSPQRALQPKMTKRECATLMAQAAALEHGRTRHVEAQGGLGYDLDPGDPRYQAPMKRVDAIGLVAKAWKRDPQVVIEALKFWGYEV